MPRQNFDLRSSGYVDWRERMRGKKLTPRVKLAIRLYASGTAKTQSEAAEMAGVALINMNTAINHTDEGRRIVSDVDRMVEDQTVSLNAIIQTASRKAAAKMAGLLDSDNETIVQKAAADLLDRNPESSKNVRVTSTPFSLDNRDVTALAASIVEAAHVRQAHAKLAAADFVEVNIEEDVAPKVEVRELRAQHSD